MSGRLLSLATDARSQSYGAEVVFARLRMRIMMRALLCAFAIAGALAITAAPSLVAAQSGTAATDDAPPSASVPVSDVKKALAEIRISWRNFNGCDRQNVCGVYFDTFGVALTFNDGTITPFAHLRRHTLSPHDCIINAREALDKGDRGLAVQWVMAAKAEDARLRSWMSDHPDAVVAALHQCC